MGLSNEELAAQFVATRQPQQVVEEEPSTTAEIGRGLVRGPFENLKNSATNLGHYLGYEGTSEELAPFATSVLNMIDEPSTQAGKIAETGSQVVSAILTTRGVGGTTFTGSMVAGAGMDFMIWDKDDGRLADVLSDAGVQGSLIEYLKHDPSDTVFEDNFKHVIEGALMGVATEAIIKTVVAGYKSSKAVLWANKTSDEVIKTVDGVADEAIVPQAKAPVEEVVPSSVEVDPTKVVDGIKPPETAFNYSRVEVDDTSKSILESMTKSSEFEEYFKTGVKPQELTEAEANVLVTKIGDDYLDFATQLVKDTEDMDVKLIAMKKVMANKIQSISTRINQVDATDRGELLKSLSEFQELWTIAGGTKAVQVAGARTTAAGRIGIIPKDVMAAIDEVAEFAPDALNKELDKFIDDATATRIHKALQDFVDVEKEVTLHKTMADLDAADGFLTKLANVLLETRTAGILSSPVTLGVNVIGNASVMALRSVEYYMAGAIGKVTGATDRFVMDELNALSNGMFTSTRETFKGLGKALKQSKYGAKVVEDTLEESYLDSFQKYDTGSYRAVSKEYMLGDTANAGIIKQGLGQVIDTAGAVIRAPYHALGFTDDLFKRSIYNGQITYIATREANKLGLTGQAKQDFIGEVVLAHQTLFMKKGSELSTEAKGLINKHIKSNDGKFHLEALERSREYTFQEEIRGAKADSAINRTLNHIDKARTSSPYGQFIVPFYRTPVNILKWVGRRTPGIHKLSQRMTDDIAAGGRRKALAQAKLTMGTSLYALGGYLAYNGMTTGTAPANEREAWKTAGIVENSVRIGDTWIQYNRADPIGMFLGVTADLNMFHQDMVRRGYDTQEGYYEHFDEVSGAVITAFTNNIMNKTWVKSLDDLMKAIEYKDPGYFSNMTATLAPYSSASRWLQAGEYHKEAKDVFEKFKKAYAPNTLRDALDIFGLPMENVTITGVKAGKPSKSKVRQEIMRLKMPISKFGKDLTFKGTTIELEPKDHWRLQRLIESKFKLEESLNKVLSSRDYKKAVDGIDFSVKGTKKWYINNTINSIRDKARKYFIAKNPELLKKYNEELQINIDSLSNKNKGLYERWLNNGK